VADEHRLSAPVIGSSCPLGHPIGEGQHFCPLCGTLLAVIPTSPPVERATQVASPVQAVGRAGTSARRQYKAMRKVWLRRIRLRFWLFAGGLGLALVLPVAVMASLNQHWVWGFGLVCGVTISMLIGIREFPPGYIANWEDGAQGEEWTAKELRPLARQGWTVMHDIQDNRGSGKGNFDHVLVGPAGVFLLDSKAWPGITNIEKGLPTLRRHEDPDLPANVYESLPRRLKAGAASVSRALKDETKISSWVRPVVVIWGGFPAGTVEDDCGVTFVRGDLICAWLSAQPSRLVPEHHGRVAAGLKDALALA